MALLNAQAFVLPTREGIEVKACSCYAIKAHIDIPSTKRRLENSNGGDFLQMDIPPTKRRLRIPMKETSREYSERERI